MDINTTDGHPTDDATILDNAELYRQNLQYFLGAKRATIQTVTMSALGDMHFAPRPTIIDGLLSPGAYLLAGAPKIGKSLLSTQIGYHISMGMDLWGHRVQQGTVLYLALEDTLHRLQQRLQRMYDVTSNHLHLAISAPKLDDDLDNQLTNFIAAHPNTNTIIIDTLQKIRTVSGDAYNYAKDYDVISKLKKIADDHNICVLLVHHTRKQDTTDVFDMISGTNGIFGAVDGALVLRKAQRDIADATLDIVGRDIPDRVLQLRRDPITLCWQLVTANTAYREPSDPVLDAIANLVSLDTPVWVGNATELIAAAGLNTAANAITKRLNANTYKLLDKYGIQYTYTTTHNGRMITLRLITE